MRKENVDYPTGFEHRLQVVIEDDAIVSELEDEEDLPPIPFEFVSMQNLDVVSADSTVGRFYFLIVNRKRMHVYSFD